MQNHEIWGVVSAYAKLRWIQSNTRRESVPGWPGHSTAQMNSLKGGFSWPKARPETNIKKTMKEPFIIFSWVLRYVFPRRYWRGLVIPQPHAEVMVGRTRNIVLIDTGQPSAYRAVNQAIGWPCSLYWMLSINWSAAAADPQIIFQANPITGERSYYHI